MTATHLTPGTAGRTRPVLGETPQARAERTRPGRGTARHPRPGGLGSGTARHVRPGPATAPTATEPPRCLTRPRPVPRPGSAGCDRGSMSVFTVIFSVVVFLLAGLLVDGGAAINARLRAADIAEQGARAAADEIDTERLRATGRIVLRPDEDAVCRRAQEIVDAQGGAGGVRMPRCEVGATEVTVAVSVRWEAFFLAALGFPGDEMEASATAAPDAGDGAT